MTVECETMQVIIPSVITVIGWFVTAWWALRQVDRAHEKNSVLQKQLVRDSHQRELAKEVIDIYKCIARSGNLLVQSISSFAVNYSFQQGKLMGKFELDSVSLIPKINEAYSSLSEDITRLAMWLNICDGHLPDTKQLRQAIHCYMEIFGSPISENDTEKVSWVGYQGLLVAVSNAEKMNPDAIAEISDQISQDLRRILKQFADGAKIVNRELLTDLHPD